MDKLMDNREFMALLKAIYKRKIDEFNAAVDADLKRIMEASMSKKAP